MNWPQRKSINVFVFLQAPIFGQNLKFKVNSKKNVTISMLQYYTKNKGCKPHRAKKYILCYCQTQPF